MCRELRGLKRKIYKQLTTAEYKQPETCGHFTPDSALGEC